MLGVGLVALMLTACSTDDDTSRPSAGGGASTTSLADDSGVTKGTITILTYNVAGLPEGMSSSNPSVNSPLISPKLNDYDLVLLQENFADPDPDEIPEGASKALLSIDLFHDDIVRDATHPYQSDPEPLPLGTDTSRPDALINDGLNRLSTSKFGDLTRVRWNDCYGVTDGASDCLSQKGFSVATHTLASGVEVDVYNLHGEAGNTDRDQELQAADFEQLAAFIEDHSAGRAVIVGGDTNLHTEASTDPAAHEDGRKGEDLGIWKSFLDQAGLVDVCDQTDCGSDAGRIDKVAVRSVDGITLTATSRKVPADDFLRDDGEPLSDHEPVVVELGWKAS